MTVRELRDLLFGEPDEAEVVVATNVLPEDHGLWTKAVPVGQGFAGWYDSAHDEFYLEPDAPGKKGWDSYAVCLCPEGKLPLRKAAARKKRT